MNPESPLRLWLNPDGTVYVEDPDAGTLPLIRALEPLFSWQSPVAWAYGGALARTRRRCLSGGLPTTSAELWRLHDRLLQASPAPSSPSSGIDLLTVKRAIARKHEESCSLCAHACGVNRKRDERGPCGVGVHSFFASAFLHEAEEPEIAPSFCIPLTGCSWHCVYCHTPELINTVDRGQCMEPSIYADLYTRAAVPRARSLSFVGGNPDQHLPAVLDFLAAAPDDFALPIVWNSNMYGSLELYRLLDGIVDTHVGDLRYGNDQCARRLSGIEACWETVARNWRFVAAQDVGLIARLLILPGHVECCAVPVLEFIAGELPRARLSILDQFQPAYATQARAPEMARRPSMAEVQRVFAVADALGIDRVGARSD